MISYENTDEKVTNPGELSTLSSSKGKKWGLW